MTVISVMEKYLKRVGGSMGYKFKDHAELWIIGMLYTHPDRFFSAGELSQLLDGKITNHQVGAIAKLLVIRGLIERHKVVGLGWQTRYSAKQDLMETLEETDNPLNTYLSDWKL